MKWFYNLKIGVKLISSFIIVSLIAGAIGLLGIININRINNLDTDLYNRMTQPLGDLISITQAYESIRTSVRDIMLQGNNAGTTQIENTIKEESDTFDKNLNIFSQTLITEEGKQLVSDLQTAKEKYIENVNQMVSLTAAGKQEEAVNVLHGAGKTSAAQVDTALSKLTQAKLKLAKNASDSNEATAKNATVIAGVLVIISMIAAVLLGIFIASSISSPIKKLVGFADEIADGNLDVDIDIQRKDEVGELSNAFKKMVANTNEVMYNISNAAEQVASGAKQVSDSSVELSQGATEQASSIEELTASIEEISSQTKLNADSANEANRLAETAKENAAKGNSQMREMLKSMDGINESSSSISKIIKVIDEIAFQTNILALNAAVEAARAGQHGKGFAVVAEEVRNLAARSANAAKETTEMIEGSIRKVEEGTKIATETSEALNRIVDGVSKVAGIVGDIATASNEQAAGISQINQGIIQVSDVVQTNSATSEESAAASEELSSQAELLKEQVARFKLKKIKNISYKGVGMEELNPEVLRMLEDIGSRRKHFNSENTILHEAAVTKNKSDRNKNKIVLSDNEFGKY